MNTQTHLLLACVVLVPAAAQAIASGTSHTKPFDRIQNHRFSFDGPHGVVLIAIAALLGALTPDASLFVMWGIAKSQGVAESIIWQDWYYSEFWQRIGAITNSIPGYSLLAVVGWCLRKSGRLPRAGHWLWVFSLAAILHTVCDFPLHHDDGHPHFWPFSQWIYRSPVSYWDPAHHGQIWSLFEMVLAIVLLVVLWRRFKHGLTRSLVMLTGCSYGAMIAYWWFIFQ